MGAELVSHHGVGEIRKHSKSLEELEVYSRMSFGSNIRQIVARGFNIKGRDWFPQDACGMAFDRRVSPSVKNKALFSAEKAAGVGPQGQVFAPLWSVLSHIPAGFVT
jgi:hypothetical protein